MADFAKTLCFQYFHQVICFERFTPRALKSKPCVSISINQYGKITVRAPLWLQDAPLLKMVEQRYGSWINKHLQRIQTQQIKHPPAEYITGELHPYLGSFYRLNIQESLSKKPNICLSHNQIDITLPNNQPDRVRIFLDSWYRFQAIELFVNRLETLRPRAYWVDWIHHPPSLRVRKMKSRWGSCSGRGRITLNQHLIKTTKGCIDYVILHELCHIAEANHGPGFYKLLNEVLPNWPQFKSQLKQNTNLLLYNNYINHHH